MKSMRIGADIPAHGNEEFIREAFRKLQNAPLAELYLASQRHREDHLNLTHLVQQMGLEERVHLYPYFSRLEAFPCLKRDCDIWLEAGQSLADFHKSANPHLLLFVTPYHPGLGQGNCYAVRWWLDKYRLAGWKIHLLWYALDYWQARNYCSPAAVACAESKYSDFFIEVRPESQLLRCKADGLSIHTDDWCGVELLEKIGGLANTYAYDACFVNYAAFSACFESIKPYTEKILCVHDVFTNRNQRMREECRIPDYDWMSFSAAGEASALARADRVICFTQNDLHYLRSLCPSPEYLFIPPLPKAHFLTASQKNARLKVGYIASDNIHNKVNIKEFLELLAKDSDLAGRLHIRIAGPISQYVQELNDSGSLNEISCEILGFVEDMTSFFATCDVTINPERGVSGVKIKNLDALGRGIVTVGTADSFSGLDSDLFIHKAPNIAGLLPMLRSLAENPDFLEKMRHKTQELYTKLDDGLKERVDTIVGTQERPIRYEKVTARDKMRGKVSVIIPCYNVEPFVGACLESVLAQSYDNLEIICAEDLSTDGTRAEILRYARYDPRIRILDTKRKEGLGRRRNAGMEAATGKYIFFLDSDDMLDGRDALKSLVDAREETGCSVVIGGARILETSGLISEYNGHARKWNRPGEYLAGLEACLTALKMSPEKPVAVNAWGALADTQLWRKSGLRFPPFTYEDYPVVPFVYAYAKNIYLLAKNILLYRKRDGSLSRIPWSLEEIHSSRMRWELQQGNLQKYVDTTKIDGDDRKFIGLRFISHLIYKIGQNSIEKDAVRACSSLVAHVAESSGDGRISQPFFDDVYGQIKALASLDACPAETLAKMAKHLPPENLAAYYSSHA